jgi:uncharacterized membrane protein
LAHELAHLRRRDHWVRLLELCVTSFYWWFPVVWWIRRSLREAEEHCCDAWVIDILPGSERAYARTLLETIDFLAGVTAAVPPGVCGFGTVSTLRTRLIRIMKGTRPQRLSAAGSTSVAAAALLVIPLGWAQQPGRGIPTGYRVVDLGDFEPIAVNNLSQIVGAEMDTNDRFVGPRFVKQKKRGHVWDRGRWTDLSGEDDLFVTPTDINDRGQVTGWYETFLEPASRTVVPGGILEREAQYSPPHAFRTAPNRPLDVFRDDLGTLGGPESYGLSINNSGQVAGRSSLASAVLPRYALTHAFCTGPDRAIDPRSDDLSGPDGRENAYAAVVISDRGDVVFNAEVGTLRRAFHAAPGRAIDPRLDDLGPDENPGAELVALNDQGQAIGTVYSITARRYETLVSFRIQSGRRIDTIAIGYLNSSMSEPSTTRGTFSG